MSQRHGGELPPDRAHLNEKAIRLEWITIGFLVSAVILMYLTLGSSQAMKAAWVEDLLSFIPPIAFLVAARVRYRKPDEEYPYGHHRVVSIAYMAASMALLFLGILILYDSVSKMLSFEHPPVGLVQPFGEPIWLGWLMIIVLLYTIIPAVILGRMKIKLARELQDKTLFADAEMNKADWTTAGAAALGILGIRFGLWWADAVAAMFISLSIVNDGVKNIRAATGSLMDRRPHLVDASAVDPLPARVATEMRKLDWVEDVVVRLREEGHVFYGDITVVPSDERGLTAKLHAAREQMMALDWRLYDVTIYPVPELTSESVRE